MTARVKVAFVLHRPDGSGGTERATFLLTRALKEFPQLEVSIVGLERTLRRPFFDADLDVPLQHLVDARRADPQRRPSSLVKPGWRSDFSEATDRAYEEWLATARPDVVVTTTPGLLAVTAQLAPASTRIVVIEHRASQLRGQTAEPLWEYAPKADAIVALSDDAAAWWRTTLGDASPPLATIPNPLPLARALRSPLRRPMVLAVGRMVPSKQFPAIVGAFAHARRPGWRLRLVGEGPDASRVRQAVRRRGLCDHVDLIASLPDLTSEYAKSSMVVMASRAEGQPLVAMEAQRAGVPVVAYDCPGGTASVVTHGRNGVLVPLDDDTALADAIGAMMDDPDRRREMGAAAWVDRRRFDPADVARRWAEVLVKVGTASSRRSAP